ncbi:Junctional adhesion molecule C [Nibea albiflora]|uniref:Junctional adhesion molecule C n=1 Tax=Nibea albiflora TaxID=240163 RepID=A0ACB7F0Z8_NIBAL|nr:Junctional adhesion molecule C [Nibea albiflora]
MISTHICGPASSGAIVSVATFAQRNVQGRALKDGYDMLVSSLKVPVRSEYNSSYESNSTTYAFSIIVFPSQRWDGCGYFSVLAVVLKTNNESPWTNEFDKIELSCLIESISTTNPRIEWKKITNEGPSYVYFDKRISGDLENRAVIREPATLVITNATRSDTAKYRCEVTAADDQKSFDEIVIDLVVRVKPVVPKCSVPKSVPFGKSAELSCVEDEGFPKSQYQWFKSREEIPIDPKTSHTFFNSSYLLNAETGTLKFISVRKEDAGEYFCRAKNDAGFAECPPQMMEVYDIDVVGIVMGVLVVVIVLLSITAGICCAYKRGFFSSQKQTGNNYKVPAKGDGVDYVRTEDEVCREQLDLKA